MRKDKWEYGIPAGILKVDRPLIMGILNVTPDSFSDGGQFYRAEDAYRHAQGMVQAGADIIDVGAESTRPGAEVVDTKEEWRRLEAVLRKLRSEISIPISIDTFKSEIAQRALDSGVDIINDISGLTFDSQMVRVASRAACPVIIMHIRGTPRDMQQNLHYDNLMEELHQFFQRQVEFAEDHGISQLILDPGIGFGKRLHDNLEIIRRLSEFRGFGFPLLVGPSRKSFIGRILDADPEHRLMGTAATGCLALNNGAQILRVHDVAEMKQLSSMVNAVNFNDFLELSD
ncbi:MAG: dihydropteroate synthase [bacterium]|nr:MAG: dihydropteroate synthase [bacterium]